MSVHFALPKRFSLICIICLCLMGCASSPREAGQNSPKNDLHTGDSARQLCVSAAIDENADWKTFSPDELGTTKSFTLTYGGLADVMIEIESESMPLEQAIKDDLITVEDIAAQVLLDAGNNVCKETFSSDNGLTTFIYSYPKYDVKIINDVYETPDSKQHLIRTLGFYRPGIVDSLLTVYWDEESIYGYLLDREDWGLAFTVSEATPTSLTIHCTQSDGQQIGELQTEFYTLYDTEGNFIIGLDGSSGGVCEPMSIKRDAESELTITWENSHGRLPSGSYAISLEIKDIYDESQVSSLTRNFHDRQPYYIEFTIP